MDVITSGIADNLFIGVSDQGSQMATLASQALSSGIDKFQNGDYKGAAEAFNRAFGLSMDGAYAYEAVKYASMAHQAMGDNKKAIQVYEKAIKVNATDDRLFLDMGNLLFAQGRYSEALDAMEAAVRLYDDSTNRYSLGQVYLKLERYSEATRQFEKIVQMGGDFRRNGYFGLAQTYRVQEKYDEAVTYFRRAFDADPDFFEAYAQIGYTYADAGDLNKAEAIQSDLESMDGGAAVLLSGYIHEATRPRIVFAYANSSFQYYSNPKTKVSVLDDYLASANASKTFAMQFQFNKGMDRESVENITNWSITRSSESGPGMAYNYNLNIPVTEIRLPQFPVSVYYDDKNWTATVRFNIAQNADADGTIDPKHIVFAFSGKDADGNEMDEDFDQFMGFSGTF